MKQSSKICTAILLVAIVLTFSACSKKTNFQTSSVVPAARGFVKIKKDNNNNYQIKVDVRNLAEVARLSPPAKTYIIWMESNTAGVKNIGQIKSDNSLLSKNLKANFETVSAEKPTRIFITAEENETATYPGYQIVLTTGSL